MKIRITPEIKRRLAIAFVGLVLLGLLGSIATLIALIWKLITAHQ